MENYKLINDKNQLLLYTQLVAPKDMNVPESSKFVLTLKVRNKYGKRMGIEIDEKELRNVIVHYGENNIIDEISSWECPLGVYKSRGVQVPNEALVVYAMPNYRIQITCVKELLLQLQEISWNTAQKKIDLDNLVMSHTVKGQHSRRFLDFDIDNLNFDLGIIPSLVNIEAVSVIRTHGGYHVLVENEKVNQYFRDKFVKNFFPYIDKQYKKIKLANGETQLKQQVKTDCLLPVPGTVQSINEDGTLFVPHFVIYQGEKI